MCVHPLVWRCSGSVPDRACLLLLLQEAGWAHVLEQLGVVPAPKL